MPLDPLYVADPTNPAQPLDTVSGGYAAREIRALKQHIIDEINDLSESDATGGAGGNYTVAAWPDVLITGHVYEAIINHTNTGAATLVPGAGAAVDIVQPNGDPLTEQQLTANMRAVFYKAGSNLILTNPFSTLATSTIPGIVKINDTVVSTETDAALTANQGRLLEELIQAVNTAAAQGISTNAQGIVSLTNNKADTFGNGGNQFNIASAGSNVGVAIRRTDYGTQTLGGTVKIWVTGTTLNLAT